MALPSGIITATGWVIATQGFAVYVRLSADANQLQSSVGTVLLGLTLIHLLSIIMLVGAEVNDVITRRAGVATDPVPITDRITAIRDRLEDHLHGEEPVAAGTAGDTTGAEAETPPSAP